jgi:hypothetical protein
MHGWLLLKVQELHAGLACGDVTHRRDYLAEQECKRIELLRFRLAISAVAFY